MPDQYTITISKTTIVKKPLRQEWTTLRQEFISQQEYESLDYENKKSWKLLQESEISPIQYMREIKGYQPEQLADKEELVKIFEQVVEDLNVKAVINAVNSMPDRILYDPTKFKVLNGELVEIK